MVRRASCLDARWLTRNFNNPLFAFFPLLSVSFKSESGDNSLLLKRGRVCAW